MVWRWTNNGRSDGDMLVGNGRVIELLPACEFRRVGVASSIRAFPYMAQRFSPLAKHLSGPYLLCITMASRPLF